MEGSAVRLPRPAPISAHPTPLPHSSAPSSLTSRPCSCLWELPVLHSVQFRNVFPSVWFANCFVYAVHVPIPEDCSQREWVCHALYFLRIPRSVGLRENVLKASPGIEVGLAGAPQSPTTTVTPCRKSHITPKRFISKSLT